MSLVLQSSGGGQITIQEPATASNFTQTLPAATGTVMVSGNMPAFSATASTTTTLSANTWTKVNYATETWDTNNNFASSRFTPTVAGYYQINATFGEGLSAAGMNFYIAIYKNATEFRKMQYVASSAWYTNIPISAQVYCNGSTDYIEIYAFTSSAYTNTAAAATNYFDGYLVRAA
jgi:hypothetical protein